MRRRLWTGHTLRARLTVGLVLVLLIACAVTGIATALFLRGFLVGRLDDQLALAGGRYSSSLERYPGAAPSDGDADNTVPGQSVGTLGVRVAGGEITDAAVVRPDGRNRRLTLSAADRRVLRSVRADGRPHTIDLGGLGGYRVRAVDGRDGDIQITGLTLHEVNETVSRLGAIEVALFSVVAALSGLVTAIVVRRSLDPLRRVAATALHVSDLPLTDAATPLPAGIAPAVPTSEVDQVSVAFDRMLDHLRTALASRDRTEAQLRRFVADASHELRTPLATIRAYAEYAARADPDLPPATTSSLSRIDAAALRMTSLVDDLLLLARLDAGRPLARDDVDLTQLAVETVDDARTAAPSHHWRLDLPDEPVTMTGDAHRLHQVVANLLTNASKHTPAGTTVTCTLEARSDHVALHVADDGPGIVADDLDGLFDRFTRVDPARSGTSRDGEHGSTGLGLAIARGIAVAHHGELTVQSRPGRTCFTVVLPVRPADVPGASGG